MVRSESTARESLLEFELVFGEIVSVALRQFVEEHAQLRYRYTARTEASIIHDYMRSEARKKLADHPRIRLIDKGNRFLILVGSEWQIKLKKLDNRLRTRNIETQTVLDFIHQMSGQGLLFGGSLFPTNLHLGYVREGAEIAPSSVFLVCPSGRRVEWDWPLLSAVSEVGLDLTVEPQRVAEPEATPKRRVKPKIASVLDEQDGEPKIGEAG